MDPELEAVIALLPPDLADPAVSFADPPALRARLAGLAEAMAQAGLAPAADPRVSRRDLAAPGADGEPDVPVRVYQPEGWYAYVRPTILHIHGGAFVMGGLDQDDVSCERLALASRAQVVSVGYRLAPEHPYPAAVTDCFTVYRWLTGGGSGLSVDQQQIVVTGVSAGGGLAAAVALMARDAGGTQPSYQLLLYPVLDDRMVTHSMRTLLDQPLWNGRSSTHMWRHYLGPDPSADTSPYAAPSRATDLTGLPPAAITTAEFDPLRDEAIEYAQRLMQAGVPTELHVVPGVIHAFDGLAADIRLARRVRDSRFAALATLLARTPQESAVTPGQRWMDPQVATVLPRLPAMDPADLAGARTMLEGLAAGAPSPLPGEELLTITDRTIPGPPNSPEVPVRIYQPRESTGPVGCIVNYHGGAFALGSVNLDHGACVRFASQLGAVVVSVDYRLAPEHPFPAGVDDCYAVLVWVRDNAASLGIAPERIAVSGASAGGALAAAVALMARDRSGPPIRFQALQIPVTDDRLETWSSQHFSDTPMFHRPAAELMWERYLGPGYSGRETSPYAAPARASDLSGLPPAYVQTADLDPLRDEGIAYAERLLQAGVPVELHAFPGTFHGSGMAIQAAVSQRAAQELVDVLAVALEMPA